MTTLAILMLSSLPTPSAATVETLDLGKLSVLKAGQLEGRLVRVAFTVDLFDAHAPRGPVVEARSKAGLLRCVQFNPNLEVPAMVAGDKYVAEGVLAVRFPPERVLNGQEYRPTLAIVIAVARIVTPH
jgi:hypothetical protein